MKRASPRRLSTAAAWIGAALALTGASGPKTGAPGLALTGVNVVDVLTGRIDSGRTVVISGDRIVAVQGASVPVDRDATVVPSPGKFVIPGLWDMHAHVVDEPYLGMFVANGVIGVRDMGGGLDRPGDGCESVKPSILRRWRAEMAAGTRIGPELVVSGPAVSGTGWPSSLTARTPAQARAAVRRLKRERVDFVKVYEQIPLPAYRALASETKKLGLPFAGHVSDQVGVLTAILAGQRSIEHLRDPLMMCFTPDPAELSRFFAEDRWSEADRLWGRAAHAECARIIAAFQANEAWLTPTLTVEKAKVSVEDRRHVDDVRRRLLPRSVGDGYARYVRDKLVQTDVERASERLWWRTQQRLVGRLNRAGVPMLAGTDSACQGGLPGASLQDELGELVASGLTPLGALRAATIEPARYLRRADEGQVRPGFRANLLVLDANPLTAIGNTRRIQAVVLRGRLLRREDLGRLAQATSAPGSEPSLE